MNYTTILPDINTYLFPWFHLRKSDQFRLCVPSKIAIVLISTTFVFNPTFNWNSLIDKNVNSTSFLFVMWCKHYILAVFRDKATSAGDMPLLVCPQNILNSNIKKKRKTIMNIHHMAIYAIHYRQVSPQINIKHRCN